MTVPLRTAVIGVGYLGRFHAQKYAALDNCELIAVADNNPKHLKAACTDLAVPGFADYRELLHQVDAVSIVVPTPAHYGITRACLEADCHVLVEKPFTSSVDEAAQLIDLARARKRLIQVGLLERFNVAFRALESVLDTPCFIETHRLAPWNSRGSDVDVTLDLMIHDIDLILTVIGEDPSEVRASGAAVVGDTLDIANARLEFPSGCVVNVTASRLSTRSERRMRVFQQSSCYTLDLHQRTLERYHLRDGEGTPEQRIAHTVQQFDEADSLLEEIRHFVACIQQHATPLVSGEDGLRALRTAVSLSARMRETEST